MPCEQSARTSCVAGLQRQFCCAGCEAAALTIAGLGLADYYRLRTDAPARPEAKADRYVAYDDAAFQSAFVRDVDEGVREAVLLLEGVRCSACLWLIEESLKRRSGVQSIEINYSTHRAILRWRPDAARLSGILHGLAALGYEAHPCLPDLVDAARRAEQRRWLWRLFVACFGMMQVMMYAVPAYIDGEAELASEYETLMRWASLALTLPVVLYSAQPFFAGALRGLRARRIGMDVPVAIGIAIAFGASVAALFLDGGEVYFDSLTMFVFLLLLGRYLELLGRNAAGRALNHLARIMPVMAERMRDFPATRATETVHAAALSPGDVLLVRPGQSVPADGVVLEGRSAVDEALLSGETSAVSKVPGADLTGGSVNIASPLLLRVTRVGAATTLATIVRLVERAAAQKHPLAESADRYARYFVVAILAFTAAAAVVWLLIDPARAPWIAVSLLVATCPCALSLATPVALTAATGRLARLGIIVTRGHAIESLARASDFVFDKTGTLTDGRMSTVACALLGSVSRARCLAIAQGLEAASEHPVGKAIHEYAEIYANSPPACIEGGSLRSVPGAGVEGLIAGEMYRLGSFDFCAALSRDADTLRVAESGESGSPHTRVWLARKDELLARFELCDRLKEGAGDLVAALKSAGRRVHLLSGDGAGPVQEAARALGIDTWRASASPQAKHDYVRELQRRGARVAMIGDGINDAPVLACADVSVAMGGGATLAQTHADAVLISARAEDLSQLLRISRRTLAIVHQNLGWAFAYNLAIVPAAAIGMVSPWLAGLGMSLSSLLVVLNALRLRGRAM